MKWVSHTLTPVTKSIARQFPSLSRREAEVCFLVANRLSAAEIASCLSISPRTAEKHLEQVFKKVGVHCREQLRERLGILPFPRD